MPFRAQHTLRHNADIEPVAALAAAVIECAVEDALAGREDARLWLRRSRWCTRWCDVAGVDVDTVREMFERRMAEC
jgi:hypothetical protein